VTRWILVVEDERALAEMLCDNLRADGFGTELVGDGDAALASLSAATFDLVILDVMLPRRDGFQVLSGMRRRGDRTPVLVLSARASDADRIRGLELQADDYLAKPFHLRELLLRVGALLRRSPAPPGSDQLRFGGNSVDFRALTAHTWRRETVRLTSTEARLLRLLASRKGEVVGRREVVEQLFGPATPPTARTIDNLIAGLRRRFEPDRRQPRHLETVRGVGWRFTP
jgi:two-component system alkaline phosphatase synthesis response regulator PhoP